MDKSMLNGAEAFGMQFEKLYGIEKVNDAIF